MGCLLLQLVYSGFFVVVFLCFTSPALGFFLSLLLYAGVASIDNSSAVSIRLYLT